MKQPKITVVFFGIVFLLFGCSMERLIQYQFEISQIELDASNVACFGEQSWTNLECFDDYTVQGRLGVGLSIQFNLSVWKPHENFNYDLEVIEKNLEKSFADLIETLFNHFRSKSWDKLRQVEMSIVPLKVHQLARSSADGALKIAHGYDFVSFSFEDDDALTAFWLLYNKGNFNLQRSFEATEFANE